MNSPSGDVSTKLFSVVFVLGGPGSGKGTQCSNLSKTFGYVHLSAGDLLRMEKDKPHSEHGRLIIDHMQRGSIVPIEITCSLIERAMRDNGTDRFLIDGFPRNQNNFDGWTRQMSDKVAIQAVLYFDCSDETCVKRCLSRGSGRDDDNEETLKRRLVQFKEEGKPIIDYFSGKDLVFKINADRTVDEVFSELQSIFRSFQKVSLC